MFSLSGRYETIEHGISAETICFVPFKDIRQMPKTNAFKQKQKIKSFEHFVFIVYKKKCFRMYLMKRD